MHAWKIATSRNIKIFIANAHEITYTKDISKEAFCYHSGEDYETNIYVYTCWTMRWLLYVWCLTSGMCCYYWNVIQVYAYKFAYVVRTGDKYGRRVWVHVPMVRWIGGSLVRRKHDKDFVRVRYVSVLYFGTNMNKMTWLFSDSVYCVLVRHKTPISNDAMSETVIQTRDINE